MKKNILLIFTFIISFILLIDNAYAAKETKGFSAADDLSEKQKEKMKICEYGQVINNIKVVFYIDSTNHKIYSNLVDRIKNDEVQTLFFEFTKTEFESVYFNNDNKCPKIYSETGTVTGEHGEIMYSYYLYLDGLADNDETKRFASAEDLSESQKKSMGICEYEDAGIQDRELIFYIDRIGEKIEIYSNIDELNKSEQFYFLKFTKESFESKYRKNNECPKVYSQTSKESDQYGTLVDKYYLYLSDPKKEDTKELKIQKDVKPSKEEKKEDPKVEINNCSDLFGEDLIEEINKVMDIIRIAVPILLIVFGIVDFFKATFDNSEDEMKKDRDRFIKRIIAAIIVFLVPFFVNLVLDVANTVWSDINTDTCISTNE